MRITHPHLYHIATVVRTKLRSDPVTKSAAALWPSSFNAISAIINRQTPHHRDTKTWKTWPDILTTFGNYRIADLELREVGLRLQYKAKTMVVICGSSVTHGVEASDGERVCMAFYMRSDVHDYTRVVVPHWATMDNVEHGKY